MKFVVQFLKYVKEWISILFKWVGLSVWICILLETKYVQRVSII